MAYNKEFINEFEKKYKIEKTVLEIATEQAIKEIEQTFPSNSQELKQLKLINKLKLQFSKNVFQSNLTSFVGIVIGVEQERDAYLYTRNKQLELFTKAKEVDEKNGNSVMVDKLISSGVVRVEDNGVPIAIWPKLKKDGTESKLKGQDIPYGEEAFTQTIYGVCSVEGTVNVRPFVMTLTGSSIKKNVHIGKIVGFQAFDKTKPEDNIMSLSSSSTSFIPASNQYLEDGIKEIGVTGIVSSLWKDYIISYKELNNYYNKALTGTFELPDNYRNFVIIKELLVNYQNFTTNDKGKGKIIYINSGVDDYDFPVMAQLPENTFQYVDYAKESIVMACGKLWIPPGTPSKQNPELIQTVVFLSHYGSFAYNGCKIEPIEANNVKDVGGDVF